MLDKQSKRWTRDPADTDKAIGTNANICIAKFYQNIYVYKELCRGGLSTGFKQLRKLKELLGQKGVQGTLNRHN